MFFEFSPLFPQISDKKSKPLSAVAGQRPEAFSSRASIWSAGEKPAESLLCTGHKKKKPTPEAWLSFFSYRSLRSQPASAKIRSSTSSKMRRFFIIASPPFLLDSIV